MKANAMFIHRQKPQIAIQSAVGDFFAIQIGARGDVRLSDEITGDLATADVKWFFNVTQGTLFKLRVLGKFANLKSAIHAAGG